MVRVIIRAVPARAATVDYLRNRIPEAEVIWDPNQSGFYATFLSALASADGPTLHLEDDITLTRRFMLRVEAALSGHRSEVVQFFSLRKSDLTAGSRYDRRFVMTQAFYTPPGLGPHFARWIGTEAGRAARERTGPNAGDLAFGEYLKARGLQYWLHVPSLVQHNEVPSILGPRSSRRQSPTFTDPDPIGETDGNVA